MEIPGGRRALIVDDDTMVRTMLADALGVFGYIVDAVDSGQKAIACFAAGRYDVVLTDLLMPGMSGIALLSAVRERDLDLPVLVISGAPDVESAAEAVRYGAAGLAHGRCALPSLEGRAVSTQWGRREKPQIIA